MENKNMNLQCSIYLYEIIERIIRFDIHLDEIKEQFYCDNPNKIAFLTLTMRHPSRVRVCAKA